MTPNDERRLHALVARLCDAEISEAETEELSRLLNNDQQALLEYMDLTAIEFHLHRQMWVPSQTSAIVTHQLREVLSTSEPSSLFEGRFVPPAKFRKSLLLAIAASVVISCGLLVRLFQQDSAFVARINDQIDCSWGDTRWGQPKANSLETGRVVEFQVGLMTIEFGKGAEVRLEGPVRFEIMGDNRGYLRSGRLTAHVPQRAAGFSVDMPLAVATDLGTKFGAYVDDDGDCETHVFEGKVIVKSRRDSDPKPWQLDAAQAIRFARQERDPQEFAARPEAFSSLQRQKEVAPAGALAEVTSAAGSGLTLCLQASNQIQVDSKGSVSCWGDICYGDNTVADNAWQVKDASRPQWIPEALGGRPAVRFNGSSYLVTSPFTSSDDVTVICVFRSGPQAIPGRPAGQLINFNSQPTLFVEQVQDNQLIGAVSSASPGHALSGRVAAPMPDKAQPVVCAYVYGSTAKRSSLYVNSELVGESQAPLSPRGVSTKSIGKSNAAGDYFVGDIYEILLFNSELSSDECIRISSELMKKYHVSETDREPRVLSGLNPKGQ